MSISSNVITIERKECFNMKGIELFLPGTIVIEYQDEKVIRITDYIDFLTCVVQTFIGTLRLLIKKIGFLFSKKSPSDCHNK